MQRMSVRKFCAKYGASYCNMLRYCKLGLLPHTGGGRRGSGISIWDEDAIKFLRDQDKKQAEEKAAALAAERIAASTTRLRIVKPCAKTFKDDLLTFKKEVQQAMASRKAAL